MCERESASSSASASRRGCPKRSGSATSWASGSTSTTSGRGVTAARLTFASSNQPFVLQIDGGRIVDSAGVALDGDRDGTPGGTAVEAFFRRLDRVSPIDVLDVLNPRVRRTNLLSFLSR